MEIKRKCDICEKEFTVADNRIRSLRCSKECMTIAHIQLKKNWQGKNKDRVDICRDRWKEDNHEHELAKACAHVNKRRATKLSATVNGFDKDIIEIYEKAKVLQKEDGINREVHHIVPLQQYSEIVCGLHVPWNLEILTEEQHLIAHEELRKNYGRTASNDKQ